MGEVVLLCSVALQQTSIWTSAIGVEKFENANSAIEEMIYAPGQGGGGRKAKQQVPRPARERGGGVEFYVEQMQFLRP